ncbi:CHRD domain-containing protein [Moorena bouillonii]|uniref:CHRD domain-containing protein n=1 Tax=Moorena bouillonii PNG TaxID=568701 RepID=A0A1U7MVB0_9CYAN|nr:CHRD domain-containing protein [Moorena bouillonii]OLT56109.1 hypothetical protein BJP37_32300 [Moorena bouillonii PNG]
MEDPTIFQESAPFGSNDGLFREENGLLPGVENLNLEPDRLGLIGAQTFDLESISLDQKAVWLQDPELISYSVLNSDTIETIANTDGIDIITGHHQNDPQARPKGSLPAHWNARLVEYRSNYKDPLTGDADSDGDLDTDDLALIVRASGTKVESGDPLDVNGDGRVTTRDARKVLRTLFRNDDYEAPLLSADLSNDTTNDGGTNSDRITADPSISGVVTDASQVTRLYGSLDDENFTDITHTVNPDGSFSLNRPLLEQINGSALGDGEQTLHLQAKDQWGNLAHFDLDFTMNRVLYTVSNEDSRELALVNTETDQMILLPLDDIEGWEEVETQLRSTEPRYFEAELTPEQVYIPEGEPSPIGSGASGIMKLVLDPTGANFGKEGPAIKYTIELEGVDLGGTSTETTADDVTAIHLHSGSQGAERIGPHTLNIFGLPGEDDDDAVFDFENNTITGIWDNLDSINSANNSNTSNGVPDHHLSDVLSGIEPLTTKTVSEYADELLAGNLYLQVHTNEFDIPGGVLRGQVEEVPGDGTYEASTEGFIESTFVEHILITPDEQKIYMTVNGSLQIANAIVGAEIRSLDWEAGTADLSVVSTFKTAEAGEPTVYPIGLSQVDDSQPIQSWPAQAWNQVHGPSIQPGSPIIQFSQWTSDRLFFINDETNELVEGFDPLVIEGVTEQTHGVFYNPSGTIALSPSYYWDLYDIDLYKVNPDNTVSYEDNITLSSPEGNGAFTHYVSWIDDRYAYTANMQYGPTSLTPEGVDIVGPGIWLIDAVEGTAERIIGTAATADDTGIFRNPSDLIVVGDKLYVAEEDSLDGTFGEDGYIAVYDISDKDNPEFIKRLKPGEDLPADFQIAHGLSPSADGSAVYVASYRSNYLIKIDTETDTVAKVYSSEDGLQGVHGGFAAGASR